MNRQNKRSIQQKVIKQTWSADELVKSFSIERYYACDSSQPSLEQLFEITEIPQVDPRTLIDYKEKK